MGGSVSTKLSPEIIVAAIAGFESQRQHIDSQIADLRAMLNGGQPDTGAASHHGQHRKVSAAARKRMAEGQGRRWAAAQGVSEPATSRPKRKRRLSAAGRAAIVAALKKRWALKRAVPARPQLVAGRKAAPKKAPVRKAA